MAKAQLLLGSAVVNANLLPGLGAMPHYSQGSSNACGTTSLAMAMTYLGVPKTHQQIDQDIRRMDIFTSPQQLIRYARGHDLEAAGYNGGTYNAIVSQISVGRPCICMFRANWSYPDPPYPGLSGEFFHYVVMVGYGIDPRTKANCLIFHDPYAGDNTAGVTVGLDLATLFSDFDVMWDDVGWNFHRYFFVLSRKGDFLPIDVDDGVEGSIAALDGVSRLTNGLNSVVHPKGYKFANWLGAWPNIGSGIGETIIGGIGGLLQRGGAWINDSVDGIPVLSNLAKPIGHSLLGTGAVLGDLASGLGQVTDDLNESLVDFSNGDIAGGLGDVAQSVGDSAQSIANAVGDAIDSAADAVSDFFDW